MAMKSHKEDVGELELVTATKVDFCNSSCFTTLLEPDSETDRATHSQTSTPKPNLTYPSQARFPSLNARLEKPESHPSAKALSFSKASKTTSSQNPVLNSWKAIA
ncbi:unnamed protein product [Dovyalis caffra]|uniref:Uncharacterized protein n=1 Tax=Dovyalis caffra TaxID=77055 RepID=A0AAV1RG79_9ROSI|nr:unnamed protein product [Dovyalis caffra]